METSMNYLSPSEYESFGLEATTPAALILAASSVIDSHCRRATLGVAQYDERLRIQAGRNVVRVTYIPLAIVTPASIDAFADTGELTLPVNAIGLGYSEIELVYTAGLPVIPDGVKVACAQVVRNAQATPALNVKAERIDHLRLDYFADTLLDQTVRSLLQPYVAQKVG
jgi:hypothetical protein